MPRLKQPVPLQKLAFDLLLKNVVDYCDDHSYEGYLGRFRLGIADVKRHIRSNLPSVLYAEFCRKFIDEFFTKGEKRWKKRRKKRPRTHYLAALEIMMDEEIFGLTLGGGILHYLTSEDGDRIQGLKAVDWTSMITYEWMHPTIADLPLQNLTTFICPKICEDYELRVIGSRCPKMRVLRIQESVEVTDKGLLALSPCSDLRIINLSGCSVTDTGINEMLSVNTKLEEFNLGRCSTVLEANCFNVLSRPKSLVCPSVKRLAMKCDYVTDDHLLAVVALFPNLTRLEFYRPHPADLCILKDLKYLVELDFSKSLLFSLENLKELLTITAENLTVLSLNGAGLTQNDLKFMFKVCGNVECLEFDYRPRRVVEELLIPPFKKLKTLTCLALSEDGLRYADKSGFSVGLDFGEMLSLEFLTIKGFFDTQHIIEFVMLDNVKFPNLKEVRTLRFYIKDVGHQLRQLAKDYNLNFSLIGI